MTHEPVLFDLGQVIRTPRALMALARAGVSDAELLARHRAGDFGDLSRADRDSNAQAIDNGLQIFSAYPITEQTRIWVITEGDRTMTTLLVPAEYHERFPAVFSRPGSRSREPLAFDARSA